jgi:hypothetical protein
MANAFLFSFPPPLPFLFCSALPFLLVVSGRLVPVGWFFVQRHLHLYFWGLVGALCIGLLGVLSG